MSGAQDHLVTDNYESVSSTASKKNKKKKGKAKSTNAAAGSVNGVSPTRSGNALSSGGGYDPEGSEDFDSAMDTAEGNYGYQYPTNPSGQAMPSGTTPLFSSSLPGGFEADPRSTTYSALNLTHQDLLNTANELYRRMEDPQFGNDDAYWTSLPVHLRNFIKNALPLAGNLPGVAGNNTGSMPLPPLSNSVNRGEQAMYAMAQQIVSAANQGMGLGQSVGNGLLMGNASMYPPGTGAGAAAAGAGLGKQPANGMQHHGMMNGDPRDMPGAMPSGRDGTTVSLDDGDYDSEVDSIVSAKSTILDASAANPGQTESMAKKKKKKKKKGNNEPLPPVPAAQYPLDKPTAAPPRAQQLPAANGKAPMQIPPPPPRGTPLAAGAMYPPAAPTPASRPQTAAPATAAAPPSSRAAGKQPMLNAATPAANAQTQSQNNAAHPPAAPVRSARSAGKAPLTSAPLPHTHPHPPGHNHAGHNHPPSKTTSTTGAPSKGKSAAPALPPKIWQPSSSEEREHIKSFWLSLDQNERQDLVRVEKDAVLRKMKEQQRHSCGCAVCGRKRSAIEKELETLYDAYYDELERYADHQAQYASTPGALPAPLGPGPFPGSVEVDANGQIVRPDHLAPVRRPPNNPYHDGQRHHKVAADDIESEEEEDFDDEGYDEDEDEDDDVGSDEADMGDEDEDDPRPRSGTKKDNLQPPVKSPKAAQMKPATDASGDGTDFFSFSSGSLTTMKGGILTVADDLLKNDGAKFLEMMEQLAARRMIREDMAIQGVEEDDLDEEDEEEDEEDDEDLEDDEEEDDDPILSQSERMEEGRRMFQIFAARMFEQRVLQKYRERIAEEQSRALLSELEMEQNAAEAAAARRQKEAAKKKEKKKQQKQAKEEERLKKEQDAREEALATKAKQEAADREAAKKREEEKQRREAEKRVKQEEAIRKEEEKRRRVAEEREREAEALRKKREREDAVKAERETKEKERKEKEEKDRLARDNKEKEAKAEKERLVQEVEAKKEATRRAKELAEEQEKERQAAAIAQAQARLLQQQKSAAARSAHIAQQAAKVAKPAKASTSAIPLARTAKQPARSTSATPVTAPAVSTVGQSTSSSRSSSPPKPVSTMPTPNVRPSTSRATSTAPSPAVQQPLPQQVIAQQAFGTAIQGGNSGLVQGTHPMSAAYGASRPLVASPSISPAVVLNAQVGMSGSSSTVQPSPFPSQVPGYGGPRGQATSPGAFSGAGNLPAFGQMVGMQPSPVFGQAMPGPNSASPALSRSFLADNTVDGPLSAGLRNVGLGHPSKSARSTEDMVFSPPGGPLGTSRMPSDQEPAMDFRHSFSAGPIGPGPIQPIGRPRPSVAALEILEEAGPSSSTSRRSSPPLAEKVLGSAALGAGDDDEVIGPAPRRVSNTAALGPSWSTSALAPGGGGGQWGNSGFSPSPGIWGGSSNVAQSAASANWPTSTSAFGQQTRFDTPKSTVPGPIGHMPTHGISRGFNAGNSVGGPPGMPFGQPSSLFSPPQSGSQHQQQQQQQQQQHH